MCFKQCYLIQIWAVFRFSYRKILISCRFSSSQARKGLCVRKEKTVSAHSPKISLLSFMMDNSKVRCLKCNTRGVPAHGAVSEGGSRRYSPVLLCLIGCRCGAQCSFYRAEIGRIWRTLWGEPCVCLQKSAGQKKKRKKNNIGLMHVFKLCHVHIEALLPLLIYHEAGIPPQKEKLCSKNRKCIVPLKPWYRVERYFSSARFSVLVSGELPCQVLAWDHRAHNLHPPISGLKDPECMYIYIILTVRELNRLLNRRSASQWPL